MNRGEAAEREQAPATCYKDAGESSQPQPSAAQPSKPPSSPSTPGFHPRLSPLTSKTPIEVAHRRSLPNPSEPPIDPSPFHSPVCQVCRCAINLSLSEHHLYALCPSCANSPVCHHSSRSTRGVLDAACCRRNARVVFTSRLSVVSDLFETSQVH